MNHRLKAMDEMDACVFSSDMLYNDEERAEFKAALARWTQALADVEKAELPQREWVSLTDEEIRNAFAPAVKQYFNPQYGAHSFDVLGVGGASMVLHLSRAIEAQLKQKNHSGGCAEMAKKKWRGLSTAETKVLWNLTKKHREYAQMIEAKLREYNG